MRNRNVTIVLLAIFSLICVGNLYFTWVRLSKDNELSDAPKETRDKLMQDGEWVESYKQAIDNSLSLGLDLQGGMYVTMQVGVEDIVNGLANRKDSAFVRSIRQAIEARKTDQAPFLDLFYAALQKNKPNGSLKDYFFGKSLAGKTVGFNMKDEEVLAALREEAETAIDNSFNVLRKRIDQFGVASPNLQKIPGTGRILIELPGVKDAARVRKLLRGTAKLEFWPTYTLDQLSGSLTSINNRMKERASSVGASSASDTAKTTAGTTTTATTTTQPAKTDSAAANQASKENPLFAILRVDKNESSSSPQLGYARITDTARVNAVFRDPDYRRLLPDDLALYWTAKPIETEQIPSLWLIAIKSNREKVAPLGGDVITETNVTRDENNQTAVSMNMNAEGAMIWKKMTTEYLGKSVAVVLDDIVYTYPVIRSVIAGGSSQITGNFTIEEAKDLANILKAGKLPAPARIEGEEFVGPTLGQQAVNQGFVSFFVGFLCVIIFVQLYYGRAGLVANIALIFNLFFILGASAALNVVLTLPGIAGIVLTMGMAVDANVLIYERVREELELGKSMKGSLQLGFQNAFSAIIDGNITTFLTGLILFIFGTGPIRGFAVTLMIGIATTLVTGLLVTRLILDYLVNKPNPPAMNFGTRKAKEFFARLDLQFIANRKRSYVAAGVLVGIFLISFVVIGFKLGVDFQGGRQYVVEFSKPIDIENSRQAVTVAFDNKTPVIKTVGAKNQIMITTNYLVEDLEADDKVKNVITETLNKVYPGADAQVIRSTKIGPTVAKDIQVGALRATIFSLIVMFLYIFLRFARWEFGLGALLSLLFNVIFVMGIFSLLSAVPDLVPIPLEIDQTFIAAILTIVGYTINDTVIVFDRIREDMREGKYANDLPKMFNTSIKDTLSRTIVTSTTTILSSLVLFFFGGEVLQGFMFAMILGIIVGTLSSIFIASPLTMDAILYFNTRKAQQKQEALAAATSK